MGWHCWGKLAAPLPCCLQQGPAALLFPGSAFVRGFCGCSTSAEMSSALYLHHILALLVPTQPPEIAPAEGKKTSLK